MINNNLFNPNRLRFARLRRAYTLKGLSRKLNISSKYLSEFENGHRIPPKDEFFSFLSKILQFPIKFFFLDDIISLEKTIVSFRSLARMSASIRNASLCSGQIALEFNNWVEKRLDLPDSDIVDLRGEEPETAALALRASWSLGERTIKNVIHLLEAKGVRVFSLNAATNDMDAYSFWIDNRPFIFLNTVKSVERSRFDIAHELGHLVLHKHGTPAGKEAEIEANQFASAFLMPEGDVLARVSHYRSLTDIIELKSYWLISAAALIRRMRDLHLLTEWQYRSLNIELSQLGYRKNEPKPIEVRENSMLIPKIFELLREDGITRANVANELGIYIKDIDELFFNLTLIGIEGGIPVNSIIQNEKKSHLTLMP